MDVVVVSATAVTTSATFQRLFAGRGAECFEEAFSELVEEKQINGEVGGRVDDEQQVGEFTNPFHEVARVHVFRTWRKENVELSP